MQTDARRLPLADWLFPDRADMRLALDESSLWMKLSDAAYCAPVLPTRLAEAVRRKEIRFVCCVPR
jgi:hypothetical protein